MVMFIEKINSGFKSAALLDGGLKRGDSESDDTKATFGKAAFTALLKRVLLLN